MPCFLLRIVLRISIVLLLVAAAARPALAQAERVRGYLADSSLVFLEPLVGTWRPSGLPDSLAALDPPIVGVDYRWTVGKKALRINESFRGDDVDSAELTGLIYWNPATERVEFVAVAGHGPGQGRLFIGEYRALEDGAIERIYDVFYRAPPDVPGEVYGGLRRRFREVYRPATPDSVASTLDWFHDGAWRGYGSFATGAFERLDVDSTRSPASTP